MAITSALEIEAKFAVDSSAELPDLTTLPEIGSVAREEHHELSAIYFDTPDLRLTRAKMTLRRRTGGNDSGWHIKTPTAAGRQELHAPLDDAADGNYIVPAELLAEIRSLVRNLPLKPIAQVDNKRTEITYADPDGNPVAEFCDDHVTAKSFLPAGKETRWREWEVELTGVAAEAAAQAAEAPAADAPAPANLLQLCSEALIAAGAFPSKSPSKLATALGDSVDNVPLPPSMRESTVEPGSAAAAVIAALQTNRDKIIEYDPKVRANEWDSVHQMRVATRELRSHMETFHGIVEGPQIAHIESELKSLAGLLGVARDAEVVEERWQSLLASEDSDVLDEATRDHIAHDMGREYRRAHRHVIGALNSDRYLGLLEELDQLLLDPPVVADTPAEDTTTEDTAAATPVPEDAQPEAEPAAHEQPAQDMETVMANHLGEAYAKLVKRHKKAVKNWSNDELPLHERENYFHDMRKAAKKLRYAAEAAGSATNLKTKALYKACKDMQSVLGDFQDSVTSRDKLLELAEAARRRGEDTFGYGLLYQRERMIGLEALADYHEAFKAIKSSFKPLRKKMDA
ncbi:CHAD domain protein [Corynebacterium sp. CMW7794]|uniref:CYTH and CHAD domain-containing protein n=1 Tax=Corynebacterium TaxID=1716 RepID=UPI000792C4D5|nr:MULTISPECIES: CYTH and CHAD domain-containing protein [Corynebacterium]KXI18806.1 CHAD domain protein [Corynebacterium sp. CMW7794]MBF9010809.1 CYTH and CHAD domain-containing protein [Corynebacterium phoceense]